MKTIASAILALGMFLPTVLLSQWQQTNGPFGGSVNTMIVNGTAILAGTSIGAFRSTNEGTTWTVAGLTASSVNAFCINGTSVFAGTSRGVYRTTDNGLTWNSANTGLTNLNINAIACGGGSMYAGTDGGVFRSADNGGTWSTSGTFSLPVASLAVVSNSAGATLIYAGCVSSNPYNSGLFLSTNGGATWTKLNSYSTAFPSRTYKWVDGSRLAVADNRVYVVGDGPVGLYGSGPNLLYIAFSSSPTTLKGFGEVDIHSFVPFSGANQSDLYYRGKTYLYRYRPTDQDVLNLGPISWYANCFVTTGGGIFMATSTSGVVKSTDDGQTWISSNNGMFNSDVRTIALAPRSTGGNNLIASTNFGSLGTQTSTVPVFCSTNDGGSWTTAGTVPSYLRAMVSLTDGSGKNLVLASTYTGIYRSTDAGLTWSEVDPQLPNVNGLAAIGKNVFTTSGSKVYRSIDYGYTWTDVSQGLDFGAIKGIGNGVPSSSFTSLFCMGKNSLFRSRDYGVTWVRLDASSADGAGMRVGEQALFLFDTGSGVRRSTDDGDTWKSVNNGLSSLTVKDLAFCGSKLYVATDSDGVFLSLDYGESWSAVNEGLPTLRTYCLAADSTTLYVGTKEAGVLRYEGDLTPAASLAPTMTGPIVPGTPFWVEVKVGDPNPVKDLRSISFHLSSNNPSCKYVDSTAVYGPFMVKVTVQGFRAVPSSLYFKPDAQSVSITLKGWAETSGSGVVAKAQFLVSPSTTSVRDITFSLSDVKGSDPAGNNVELAVGSLSAHIAVGGGEVWPGDCNNDGVVNAADVLPIGVYYAQTLTASNFPGMIWKGYQRDGWPNDTAKKKIYADANGDGFINSVDVLAVGLNYGKTHQVVGVPGNAALARAVADGSLQIGPRKQSERSGELLTFPVSLKSTASVYGVAFNLKYGLIGSPNTSSVKLLRIDTAGTAFGGGLMLNRISEEEGAADVGITRVHGKGFAGQDILMNLVFDAPLNAPLWVETSNVVGNDEKGNALNLAGSVFRSDAEGANEAAGVPTENALLQNYPNPFNPATTISFQLSDVSAVSLKVFDILGRAIVTLVNEEKPAGSFMVRWDATGVPSGIYCFQMTARNKSGQTFTQTRRMTIVK